jgi:zinc/manganese transport system substrate-binding protein
MDSRLASALLVAVLAGAAPPARAELRVVASVPDVADLVRQIGGERVAVESLAQGTQDPHKVPMKPSWVVKLNRADAVAVLGLGLEHAYLPGLLEAARNPKLLPGAPAYIDASLYVQPLEVPTSLSRTQGELHPLGNPHFNLDPEQARRMARAIAEGLERVDPAGADSYRAGRARFEAELERRLPEWRALAGPLRGVKAVSYHRDIVYVAERYGLVLVGEIETRPGVPATPGHVEELVERMRRENVRLVIRESSYEAGLAQAIAERTGARVATIGVLVGGLPGADTYFDLIEANLRALLAALPAEGAR